MSKTTAERDRIKKYLLKHIGSQNKEFISKAMETFSVSKTSVYAYLRQLENEGIIKKEPEKPCKYDLVSQQEVFIYNTKDDLDEDVLFKRDIQPLLEHLPKNVFDIWRYGFTEMMNNAIEHSQAEEIGCLVSRDYEKTAVFIKDNGIGVFNNIMRFFKETYAQDLSVDDAIMQLTAGKLTTAKKGHSGEGIFFTSRVFERFLLASDGRIFSHDNFSESLGTYAPERFKSKKGTMALMQISNTSRRKLSAVFDRFSDQVSGFNKTQIPIAQVFPDDYPMSRSEARRLAASIDRFGEVEIDFSNVENLGQAFTHELFVVFPQTHPDIVLIPTNCSKAVEGMINRVLATQENEAK